jgi:hypothetical protein
MYNNCIFLNEEVYKGVISPDKTFYKSVTGVKKPIDFGNGKEKEKNIKFFTKCYNKSFKQLNFYEKREINDLINHYKDRKNITSIKDLELFNIRFSTIGKKEEELEGLFKLDYVSYKFDKDDKYQIQITINETKVTESFSSLE